MSLRDSTLIQVAGISGIVILEVANLLTIQFDGVALSGMVGAIVFIVTRKRYKL